MKKKWCAAVMLLGVTMLAGCGKKATPENLLVDMAKNTASMESFAGNMAVDMGMETALGDVSMKVDLDMESTMKPEAVHMQGAIGMNYAGTDINMEMEMYELKEEGTFYTYTCTNGIWAKAESEEEDISFQPGTFEDFKSLADSFTLSEEKTKVEGQECFELKGEMKGEDLGDLFDPSMLGDLGTEEGFSEDAFEDMTIPCTVEIYSKTILPARITIDMSDVMKDVGDESATVKNFSMAMTFKEYDKVKKISLPEEAKNAGAAAEQPAAGNPAATDAWSSFEVQINGAAVKMPCSAADLEGTGLTLDAEDTPRDYIVNKQEGVYVYFIDASGNEIRAMVFNESEEAKTVGECQVGEISVSTYEVVQGNGLSVIFPEGVTLGMGRDEVMMKYGETDQVDESDGFQHYTWHKEIEGEYDSSCEISFDPQTGAATSISLNYC